jgi:cell division protein FtsL
MNRASKRARNHARAHAQTGLELVTKMMVIAIVAAVVAGVLWAQTPQNQVELEDRIEQLTAELDQARQKVDDLRRSGRIAELQEMRKPPLIVLPNDTFRFASGKAELSWEFERRLLELVPQIRQNQQDFRANTLFVIGHTDTVPMGGNGCTSRRATHRVREQRTPHLQLLFQPGTRHGPRRGSLKVPAKPRPSRPDDRPALSGQPIRRRLADPPLPERKCRPKPTTGTPHIYPPGFVTAAT